MRSFFVTGFFARGSIAVFSFITLLVTSRYLGAGVLGEMSLLVLNVAIIQSVNDIFTGPALVFFIPRTRFRSLYAQGATWTVCCVLTLNFILYASGVAGSRWADVLVISFLACGTAFHAVLLLGRQKVHRYYLLLLIQPAALCATLISAVFGSGARGHDPYLLGLYVSFTVAFVTSVLLLVGEFSEDDGIRPAVNFGEIVAKGATNQLANLAHILSNRFNYYILGAFAAVGIYSGATSVIESVWMVSAAVSPVLLTRVANNREDSVQRNLTWRLARACMIVSAAGVLLLVLIPVDLYVSVLGDEFRAMKEAMIFLAPGVLAISFSSVISHFFSGLGQQRRLLMANCCGLLVTLSLSYLLISRFGIRGAAITASLAYIAQAAFLIVSFRNRSLAA